MEGIEKHLLTVEATNRQEMLLRNLRKLEREIHAVYEEINGVSYPTEEQKKLSLEERLKNRERALGILARGSFAYDAASLCELATEQKFCYEIVRAFTEREEEEAEKDRQRKARFLKAEE